MANPGYQEYMLPILKYLKDKGEVKRQIIFQDIADLFNLSDADRRELLQSGDYVYTNRIGWALTYLKKAGLLDSPKRGFWKITKLGIQELNDKPNKINSNYLKKFDAFKEFQQSSNSSDEKTSVIEELEDESPSENLLYK